MEDDQKTFIRDHLRNSGEGLEAAVSGIDTAKWFQIPAEGRWSVGQCAEHIVTVEERINGRLEEISRMPSEAFDSADAERKDQAVMGIAARETRAQAPPFLHPSSQYSNPEAMLAAFREIRLKLARIADDYPTWLRGRFAEHPMLKKLDGYQWLLAASCHTVRHTAQIEEIKQELRGTS